MSVSLRRQRIDDEFAPSPVEAMIVLGALLGLAIGWLGAALLARLVELRTGLAVDVTLGASELAMVGALAALGCLLAALPGLIGNRQPVADGLRL
jgi:hypothetical protein